MAKLTVRFVNSPGFVSEVIDWTTNSLWDHAELGTPEGTWIAAHAGKGVQELPANYMTPSRERRYEIPCTDEQLETILKFAKSKIGTPYDYEDIIGLFLHDRKLNSNSREICSAFVFDCTSAGNLWMLNVLPGYTYLVTPEMLHLSSLLIGNCILSVG